MSSLQFSMKLLAQIDDFYRTHNIKFGLDTRSRQDIESHKDFVKKLCERNLHAFKINLTEKVKSKPKELTLERVDLQNGLYCIITDNRVKSQQTVFTIHGSPGGPLQWAKLQEKMGETYRWVNFWIPGFDGQDQRRGEYDGDFQSLKRLFLKLVIKLELKRVAICAHSFGTSVAYRLAKEFPTLIEGFVNIGGMTHLWPLGMSLMYKLTVAEFGYFEESWKSKGLYNINEEREKMYTKYVQYYKKEDRFPIPLLKMTEYFAMVKLVWNYPKEIDESFCTYPVLDRPIVNIYAGSDPFLIPEKVEDTIYRLIFDPNSYGNNPSFQNLLRTIKDPLERRLKEQFGVVVEGERIQEYLNFIFKDTGHAIHIRRFQEISKVLKIFMVVLEIIYQNKPTLKSSL